MHGTISKLEDKHGCFYGTELKVIHIPKLRSCNRIKHGFFFIFSFSFYGETVSAKRNRENSLIKSFQRSGYFVRTYMSEYVEQLFLHKDKL